MTWIKQWDDYVFNNVKTKTKSDSSNPFQKEESKDTRPFNKIALLSGKIFFFLQNLNFFFFLIQKSNSTLKMKVLLGKKKKKNYKIIFVF